MSRPVGPCSVGLQARYVPAACDGSQGSAELSVRRLKQVRSTGTILLNCSAAPERATTEVPGTVMTSMLYLTQQCMFVLGLSLSFSGAVSVRSFLQVPWTVFSATFGCCFDLKDVGGLLLRALFGFEGSTAAVVWRTRRAASGDTIALRAPLGLPLLVCRHGSALAVLSEVGFALTVASVLRYLLFTLTSSPTSGRLQFLLVVVRCYYEDRCLDDDLVLSFALKSAL